MPRASRNPRKPKARELELAEREVLFWLVKGRSLPTPAVREALAKWVLVARPEQVAARVRFAGTKNKAASQIADSIIQGNPYIGPAGADSIFKVLSHDAERNKYPRGQQLGDTLRFMISRPPDGWYEDDLEEAQKTLEQCPYKTMTKKELQGAYRKVSPGELSAMWERAVAKHKEEKPPTRQVSYNKRRAALRKKKKATYWNPARKNPQFVLGGEPLDINVRKYPTGNIAIQLTSEYGEPFGMLSVNVAGAQLREGEFILNHDMNHWRDEILRSGVFVDTGDRADYGFVTGQPILRLF
jgi:hypothetical protein